MSIYRYLDYKKLISEEINNRKKFNSKLNFSGLADAIGVQKTLVSKVLKGSANFNSDQVFLACEYLGFSEEETEFALLLLEYDRCAVGRRKRKLKESIQKRRGEEQIPEKRLQAEKLNTANDSMQKFYLDPLAQLVHAFLIVPKYAAQPQLILQALHLEPVKLKYLLKLLEEVQLIKSTASGSIRVIKNHTHLTSDSNIFETYHQLKRVKSLDQIMNLPADKKYNFSALLSTDEETQVELKELFLQFLQKAETKVINSNPEEVCQMNFDLFRWS